MIGPAIASNKDSAEVIPWPTSPMDGFRSTWYRLVVLLMTLLVPFSWFTTGPGNLAFAIQVIGWTFVLDPVLIDLVERFMPDSWFHVPKRRTRHPPPARCLHLFPPARALRMEQRHRPSHLENGRLPAGHQGQPPGPGQLSAARGRRSRHLFRPPRAAGRGHALRRVPVERAVGAAAGRGGPPLPDPAAALDPAPPPASARPRSGRYFLKAPGQNRPCPDVPYKTISVFCARFNN